MEEFERYSKVYDNKVILRRAISDGKMKEAYLISEKGEIRVDEYKEIDGKMKLVRSTKLGFIS